MKYHPFPKVGAVYVLIRDLNPIVGLGSPGMFVAQSDRYDCLTTCIDM